MKHFPSLQQEVYSTKSFTISSSTAPLNHPNQNSTIETHNTHSLKLSDLICWLQPALRPVFLFQKYPLYSGSNMAPSVPTTSRKQQFPNPKIISPGVKPHVFLQCCSFPTSATTQLLFHLHLTKHLDTAYISLLCYFCLAKLRRNQDFATLSYSYLMPFSIKQLAGTRANTFKQIPKP